MKRYLRYWLTAFLLAFIGIAVSSDIIKVPATKLQRLFIVSLHIDPNLPTLGLAQMSPGVCVITLRQYPICLLHEIRHCTEGDWHAGRDSDEDCY